MPQSELRLIKRCAEFIPKEKIKQFPRGLRGIYVLYEHDPKRDKFNVRYVGMASAGRKGGIRGRLVSHYKKRGSLWTHFSIFEVWDNIRDEEVTELEGLFRHIYKRDAQTNRLNVQRGFKKLRRIRQNNLSAWVKRPGFSKQV